MISASAVYSPLSPLSRNGRCDRSARVDVVEDDLGLEALGVRLHARHQVRAHQAVRVARPVVDFGRGHQLAALLQAGDQHRLEVGARGVDGGRQPAGPEPRMSRRQCFGGTDGSGIMGIDGRVHGIRRPVERDRCRSQAA